MINAQERCGVYRGSLGCGLAAFISEVIVAFILENNTRIEAITRNVYSKL